MTSLTESASSIGNQLGKYFSITSLLPALVFVLWTWGLTGLGLPGQQVDLHHFADTLTTWSPGKIGAILAASLILGLAVHPLLFATTQLLEGYWGCRPLAVRLRVHRARIHRARLYRLTERTRQHTDIINAFVENVLIQGPGVWSQEELQKADRSGLLDVLRASVLGEKDGTPMFATYIAQQATIKAQGDYPTEGHRIMPTRLGNALRRVEDQVGSQYGLDATAIAPHITVAAAPERAAYINDARQEMDLAIRLCFFGLLATVLTTAWLAPSGWWVLIAAIPYAVAYVTYRGAIAAAQEWGAALAACLDLDRFTMYEALRLRRPVDTDQERATNAVLIRLLQGDPSATIRYDSHPGEAT